VFCIDELIKDGKLWRRTTNFWQDDTEEIPDAPYSARPYIHIVVSLLVVWICRIEASTGEFAASKLGDSSVYKVVVIIRDGAIGHSLVPEH